MKKYFLYSLIVIFTFIALPVRTFADTGSGFIPGQIWYSKQTLVEGDTVNIHTAVWNGEKNSIGAKVEFYDKNVILGSRDIVLASLELKDVFIPWKITSGDHVISAKIISSTATISGKKENIALLRNTTSSDKQFISVVVKNGEGVPVSKTGILGDEVNKIGSGISDILPEQVKTSVSDNFTVVDNFREKISTQVNGVKENTQKELSTLNAQPSTKLPTDKSDIQDATKKPITYIKLFLFTVLYFIFSTKIVFYGIILFIVFLILRFVYLRIRNR